MSLSTEAKLLLSKHPESIREIIGEYLIEFAGDISISGAWTELIKKHTEPKLDWEIVSFSAESKPVPSRMGGHLFVTRRSNGKYLNVNCISEDGEYSLEDMLSDKDSNIRWHIHSVRRLSDGEVFTVDEFASDQYGAFKIKYFQINEDDSITAFSYIESDGVYLKDLKKYKPAILKTEDGVKIFGGEKIYWVGSDIGCWGIQEQVAIAECIAVQRKELKYFSTKEAAESYVLLNKPCLSLRDIENVAKKNHLLGPGGIYVSQPDIIEVAKQKSTHA